MLGELVRRSELSDRRVDDLVIPEMSPDLISPFLALTGLRGFWPMSAIGTTSNARDQSGSNRVLTYNGNPTYNYDGLVPYIDLDGTGDFLSRPDEAALDITGTETYVAAAVRGLTCGGWFYFNNAAAAQEVALSKGLGGAANTSYWLNRQAAGQGRFIVGDGAAFQGPTSTAVISQDAWTFIVGRFVPSTTVDLWVNTEKSTDSVGVPAALLNTAAPLNIGSYNNGTGFFLTGRASLCFLCAAALSDTIIDSVFQQTRAAYRV